MQKHPDFEKILQILAGQYSPASVWTYWTEHAEKQLYKEYGSWNTGEHRGVPLSRRTLLGWIFDESPEEDARTPTDYQQAIGLLTVVAPGIILFDCSEDFTLDFDIFGIIEQASDDPYCFKVHQIGARTGSMLNFVGRDPANPKSLYNEVVHVIESPADACHLMITDDDWETICAWLTKWLQVPVAANAG